jgi:hypothetical protein
VSVDQLLAQLQALAVTCYGKPISQDNLPAPARRHLEQMSDAQRELVSDIACAAAGAWPRQGSPVDGL